MKNNMLFAMSLLLAVPVAHAGNKERSDEIVEGVVKIGVGGAILQRSYHGFDSVCNRFDSTLQSLVGRVGAAAVSNSDKAAVYSASVAVLALSTYVGYRLVKSGIRNLVPA